MTLAWVAGFLEGEGSFFRNKGRLAVKACQVNREPLERLQGLYDGSLNVSGGPRRAETNPNRQVMWEWRISGHRAEQLFTALFPLMSEKRQEQVLKCFVPKADG